MARVGDIGITRDELLKVFYEQVPERRLCADGTPSNPQTSVPSYTSVRERVVDEAQDGRVLELYSWWRNTRKIHSISQCPVFTIASRQEAELLIRAYVFTTYLPEPRKDSEHMTLDDVMCELAGVVDTKAVDEMEHLLKLQKFGLLRHIPDFQDALIDAIAEFIDDNGLDEIACPVGLWTGLGILPEDCMLVKLVWFYDTLTVFPGDSSDTRRFLAPIALHNSWNLVPADKGNNVIWEDFMKQGRCKIHVHATGRCWRAVPEIY
jgi:hypothetical protein